MQKTRKRKRQPSQPEPKPDPNQNPYPTHNRPTREECESVRDSLLAFHGFPPEFTKHREKRRRGRREKVEERESESRGGGDVEEGGPFDDDEEEESVLDGVVKTLLSQNTTESNSLKAFGCLKSAFPSWDDVHVAESKSIEDAIRCGGLAPRKTSCIKNLLNCLMEKRGKLCLEYLHDLSVDEVKYELSQFKGIGPKTAACVLMFNLQKDDFPVDTHVFEIAKAIGWVPEMADRNKTYLHLNQRIPDELKFDLNCLLYTHGKLCRKCIRKGANLQGKESNDGPCPLLNYHN